MTRATPEEGVLLVRRRAPSWLNRWWRRPRRPSWLRVVGWLVLGTVFALAIGPLALPLGVLLFEVGYRGYWWWHRRRWRWRAVSGEAAALAVAGMDVDAAAAELQSQFGRRRKAIEQALSAMETYPKTDWQQRAVAILRRSLGHL